MPKPVTGPFESQAEPTTGQPNTGEYRSQASTGAGDAAAPGQQRVAAPLQTNRFTILKQVANGGLGQVSLARDERLNRPVALKEIRPDRRGSADLRQRFLTEAEITSQLQHPGIVPVYALDEDASGEPYYAMRFIEGKTFAEAIKEFYSTPPRFDALPFRALLQRFVSVCNTIAYAHSKGVIHRDLKPANVMLGDYGETLVVDWGLAKRVAHGTAEPEELAKKPANSSLALEARADLSALTEAGRAVGTVPYVSPEQARGDAVGPATDVYALGAMLYELLTGRHPFSGLPLSDVLDAVKAGKAPLAPRNLQPEAPKALEAICRQAMNAIPAHRYAAATDLARDVDRWLADEPVSCAHEPVLVRAGRWARKHRTLVASAAVLLVTAVVGLGLGLYFVNAEKDRTLLALDAETKARQAEKQARDKTMTALRDLTDEIVENQMARGTTLTEENKEFLRKIIKHFEGFAAITGDDAESRSIRAEGSFRVGLMRRRLGELRDAEAAYRNALAFQKELVAEFPTRHEFRKHLAMIYNGMGVLLATTGRFKEAETAFANALVLRKPLATEFPTQPDFRDDLAASHQNLALLLGSTGRLNEAESSYAEALAIRQRLAADFPTRPDLRRELGSCHNNLGEFLKHTGRPKEAEMAHGHALAIFKQLAADFPTRPEYRMDLAGSHNNLGLMFRTTGRFKEAETAYAEALAIFKELAAEFPTRPELRQAVAGSHNNLGTLFGDTGRVQQAETAYGEAIVVQRQLAADFPTRTEFRQDLAGSYHNLGALFHASRRLTEAKTPYTQALIIQKQLAADIPARPEFRQDLARSHSNLGNLFRDTGRLKEAEAAYADALAIRTRLAADFSTRPDLRQDLATSHHNLANLLRDTGRFKEAEAAYADALVNRKQLAADFPNQPDLRNELASTFLNLAILANQRREFQAARAYLDEAQPHHQAALQANPRHPRYRESYTNSLSLLVEANAGLLDQPGAVRAAEKICGLGWDSPGNAYNAACALTLCIPIIQKHDATTKEERDRQAQFYGDAAMKMLKDAVAKGYKDAAKMRKDTDLDPLRELEDFKKLVKELQESTRPKR